MSDQIKIGDCFKDDDGWMIVVGFDDGVVIARFVRILDGRTWDEFPEVK